MPIQTDPTKCACGEPGMGDDDGPFDPDGKLICLSCYEELGEGDGRDAAIEALPRLEIDLPDRTWEQMVEWAQAEQSARVVERSGHMDYTRAPSLSGHDAFACIRHGFTNYDDLMREGCSNVYRGMTTFRLELHRAIAAAIEAKWPEASPLLYE